MPQKLKSLWSYLTCVVQGTALSHNTWYWSQKLQTMKGLTAISALVKAKTEVNSTKAALALTNRSVELKQFLLSSVLSDLNT